MRVGWLQDKADYVGGAELTSREFRAAAPDGVEIVDCPAGAVVECERYVVQNCVTYTLQDFVVMEAPTVKYHNDVGPHVDLDVRRWLKAYATSVYCSPLQADHMNDHGGSARTRTTRPYIPPPVDLARFEQAAQVVNGNRAGSVCVGSWRNYGKAPHRAAAWGAEHGGIDFYGGGQMAPPGSLEVPYEHMPELLARYETFVFLPSVLEPFGRLVAEAWAAGCEIVTNGLVGAAYWIEEKPEALITAGEDFWKVVLA